MATSADLEALCREAANLIPDEHARQAFLHDVAAEQRAIKRPGFLFGVRQDLTGQWRPAVPLRSVHHATLLALPREACTRALRPAAAPFPTATTRSAPAVETSGCRFGAIDVECAALSFPADPR